MVLLEGGIIRTDKRLPLNFRLKEIYEELVVLIKRKSPSIVAMEDLYSGYKNPRTAILMGHARGVCFLAAANSGLAVESYSPARVKKALTGNGRASKKQVMEMVRASLGLGNALNSEHVADAIAVALCHLQERRLR